VVDERGSALDNVHVYLSEPDADLVDTDADSGTQSNSEGHFTLRTTPGRTVDVVARRIGLLPAILKDVRIATGENATADLVMKSGEEIRGSVRLEDGSPVEGASVIAMGPDADSLRISADALGRRGLAASFSITATDASGTFRLAGLVPGQPYLVNARRHNLVRPPGQTAVLAHTGASNLTLVMKPVVFVRLRPVDTTTGLVVPGARLEQLSSLASVPSTSLDDWGGKPRILKAEGELLLLGTETGPGSSITIFAKAAGYESVRVDVPLRLMSDDDGTPTKVGLRPTAASFGDLRLEATGPSGETIPWPAALRGVLLLGSDDRFGRGVQMEDGAAFLRHLPIGPIDIAPLAATPFDLSESLEFDRERAVVDPGAVNTVRLRLRVRLDRVQLAVRVTDEMGAVIRDSEIQITGMQDGHSVRQVRFAKSKREEADSAAFVVGPGLWTLDVAKIGFRGQQQTVRVVPGDPKERLLVSVRLVRE
jgi:hypothetical protein